MAHDVALIREFREIIAPLIDGRIELGPEDLARVRSLDDMLQSEMARPLDHENDPARTLSMVRRVRQVINLSLDISLDLGVLKPEEIAQAKILDGVMDLLELKLKSMIEGTE